LLVKKIEYLRSFLPRLLYDRLVGSPYVTWILAFYRSNVWLELAQFSVFFHVSDTQRKWGSLTAIYILFPLLILSLYGMIFKGNSFLQWAEVLSADAFSAFEDAGLDNHKVWIKGCPTDLCSLATDLLLLIFHLWFCALIIEILFLHCT